MLQFYQQAVRRRLSKVQMLLHSISQSYIILANLQDAKFSHLNIAV